MDTEFDRSRIEQAKRGLYGPEGDSTSPEFSRLSPHREEVRSDWGDNITAAVAARRSAGVRILKWAVLLSAVIMLASLAFLLYSMYDPFAKPSDKNITFNLDFPVAIASGSSAPFHLTVANANKVPLEYANLTLLFPQGTKKTEDLSRDFLKDQVALGEIAGQSSGQYDATISLFGEENTDKEVRVLLEYKFQGISSTFTKEETWPVRMISSPVNLSVKTLKEVSSGGVAEFTVTVTSNAITPLNNVLVSVSYPQGFSFESAEPRPTYGTDGWKIGSIDPSEKITIRFRGTIEGESTQEKAFTVTVGETSPREERTVATPYASSVSIVSVQKPFIGISLYFDKENIRDSAFVFGRVVQAAVEWQNNLPYTIADAEIEVRLSGTALDRYSVHPGYDGFYRSIDDAIVWDKRVNPSLALVDPSGSGRVGFQFSPLPSVSGGKPLRNPTVVVDVTIRGRRISETGVPEEVKSVSTRTVKIMSDLRFTAKSLYYTGPFINRGPIPPRAEEETTYTIAWSLTNTANDLENVEVRGTLPPYVTWEGSISPPGENVVFDRNTSQVIWKPGSIPSGTGIDKPSRDLYFQVTLLPSISHIKQIPPLVLDSTLSGMDSFAGGLFSRTIDRVTTDIAQNDPKAGREDGIVER